MVNELVLKQPGDVAVNVYVVVCWLLMAGDQMPVIPFCEVVGKAGIGVPAQTGATFTKVGVMFGLITIVILTGPVAHSPAAGVKVYVVVCWLLMAGDQVPEIPF